MHPLLLNRFGCRRNPDMHFSTSETRNEHEQTYVEAAILISSGRPNDNSTALRNVTALKLIMRSLRDVSVTLRKIVVASDEVTGFTFSSLYSASRANERINGRARLPRRTRRRPELLTSTVHIMLHLRDCREAKFHFNVNECFLLACSIFLSLSPLFFLLFSLFLSIDGG